MTSHFQLYILGFISLTNACRWKCPTGCQFPKYLQTRGDGSPWLMPNPESGHLLITVHSNKMMAKECTWTSNKIENCIHYRSYCMKSFANNKYLVRTIQTNEQETHFRCMQFLPRSKRVVQIKSSYYLNEMNETLCIDESALVFDTYPMLAREPSKVTACPIPGAYEFDTVRYAKACDKHPQPVRFESDCKPKRGIVIPVGANDFFRNFFGIDKQERSIEMSCLATWKDKRFIFSMVARGNDVSETWCLRIQQRDGSSFEAVLYRHALCSQYDYNDVRRSAHDEDGLVLDNLRESNKTCSILPPPASHSSTNSGAAQAITKCCSNLMLSLIVISLTYFG